MYKVKKLVDEKGMASILVTLFLMLIITLVVLGFARIIRRDQRQVLDRQLSTQAFYAAESGVNDAVSVLRSNPSAEKTLCGDSLPFPASPANIIDSSNDTQYTCLLVDSSPTTLIYDNIDTAKSTNVPINATSSINSLTLSWQDTDGGNDFSNCPVAPNLPRFDQWAPPPNNCDAGILRIDLVPSAGTFDRNSLQNGLTVYLYPQAGAATPTTFSYASASAGSAGRIVGSNCNSSGQPRLCTVSITVPSGTNYFLRAISIYKPNALTICANSSDCTSGIELSGAQAMVDSTGKAQDVLRRIAVRVNTNDDNTGVPIGAIQSTDTICKRLSVGPGFANYVPPVGITIPIDLNSCLP